jgi:hypothetical protein
MKNLDIFIVSCYNIYIESEERNFMCGGYTGEYDLVEKKNKDTKDEK